MMSRYYSVEPEDGIFMNSCLLNGSSEKFGKERPQIGD